MGHRVPTANALFFDETVRDADQLERLEHLFFRNIRLPNGTFKTTYRRRLDDLNALVRLHLPPRQPLDCMDVAVSSGVSTLEWIESLAESGIQCRMTAGDAQVHAYLLSIGSKLRVLVDRSGCPLQYDVAGTGLSSPLRKGCRLKFFLPALVLRTAGWVLKGTLSKPARAAQGARWGLRWRPLKLVSPSICNHPALEVVEDDILANRNYVQCFDVVRAANILNLIYFNETSLAAMLANLRRRLRDGGRLIVCRTKPDGINHGTVFGLDPHRRLQVLARLNEGSEIEKIALSLPTGT
jgi:hypothetical protein